MQNLQKTGTNVEIHVEVRHIIVRVLFSLILKREALSLAFGFAGKDIF
jgi:hypothetical protein